ncbi:SRPBCC family protein [Candidatus Poriferisodalis sp.]|uniref:SRPBCC family protein n=1 Tax=Candidatus Poriferisodalis sp. TaxID=3101277 RepID=UPI003B022AB0
MTMTTVVTASPDDCYALIADIERYPEWATDISSVSVVERDLDGRVEQAAFRVEALGRTASYTLAYDHGGAPHRLRWKLVDGDVVKQLDGRYEFNLTAEPGRTEVLYQLALELAVPLPGFVKRRAERRIAHTALADFAARLETGPLG